LWKDIAEVGPFCRKGLRSVAATCDQTCFDAKTMSPEITAPHFVSPCCIPLTLRLAAKVQPGRQDLQKSPNRIVLRIAFPNSPPGVAQPTGFLNKCRDPGIDELRLE